MFWLVGHFSLIVYFPLRSPREFTFSTSRGFIFLISTCFFPFMKPPAGTVSLTEDGT